MQIRHIFLYRHISCFHVHFVFITATSYILDLCCLKELVTVENIDANDAILDSYWTNKMVSM